MAVRVELPLLERLVRLAAFLAGGAAERPVAGIGSEIHTSTFEAEAARGRVVGGSGGVLLLDFSAAHVLEDLRRSVTSANGGVASP
eukprot:NODE_16913_length_971_cov_2.489336.p4 GENE.NODE_16913_length_971_cov_2.489336~~NODE_16913_length_971_cov_2.489336.p4  ORF type:complete len:86 (+),score=21.00 NODE_16913_length_971_cov_2.489336:250-507(+)